MQKPSVTLSSLCCVRLFPEKSFMHIVACTLLSDGLLIVCFNLLNILLCVDLFHCAIEFPKQLDAGGFRWCPPLCMKDNVPLQNSRESAYELIIHWSGLLLQSHHRRLMHSSLQHCHVYLKLQELSQLLKNLSAQKFAQSMQYL